MARRGFKLIIREARLIAFLSAGTAIFVGLFSVSLSQATNEEVEKKIKGTAAQPIHIMQTLMLPAGSPLIEKCMIPFSTPPTEECKPFFSIDEDVLENLLQNYTKCLDGHSYYINFSNQPEVTITKTLKIYGRSNEPLTIKGLKIIASENFPKNDPAIIVYGKPVVIKDIYLDGFSTGIMFASENEKPNRIIGGKINGPGNGELAVAACHTAPYIEGLEITGYSEDSSTIEN